MIVDEQRAEHGAPRRWVWVGAAAVLVLGGILTFGLLRQQQVPAPPLPTPVGSSVPPASVPPPTATGSATPEPSRDDPGEERAGLDESAEAAQGVVVHIASIEKVEGDAQGAGEVAGPALRLGVEFKNSTSEEQSLVGATVNLFYGPDRTPAAPLDGPGVVDFAKSLAPGKSALGVVVFSVPLDQRSQIAVEVTFKAGVPVVVFEGKP